MRVYIALLIIGFMVALPASAANPIHVTVGAFAPPGSPWDKDWQTFKTNAEFRSNSGVKVKLLVRGEAGAEPITMSNIRRGRLQFGGFTLSGASAVVPELSMLLSPFFFNNRAELDYVMDDHMLAVFRPLFAEKNLYLIRWVDVGWLHMYGRKPIVVPSDAKGFRLRSQASEASQRFMTAIGGDMLQMSFQDLIPALQTGLVAGGETGVVIYGVTGLGREAPHLTLTNHSYDTGMIVANYKWFMSLPHEERVLIEGAFPSSAQARAGVRGMTGFLNGKIAKDPAITVHELTADQRALWIAATQNNYKEIMQDVGGQSRAVYDAMVKAQSAYKACAPKCVK